MKYMGSKRRLASQILKTFQKYAPGRTVLFEPFCGGANLTIAALKANYLCNPSDCDPYLIAYLRALAMGWEPPRSISEQDYRSIRDTPENYPRELVGYVGFALSYGGKWFGGWRRDKQGKRNYCEESWQAAKKEQAILLGQIFHCQSYDAVKIPAAQQPTSLIYADPPYAGTTAYRAKFNSGAFWEWAAMQPVPVFVSEYTAPPGWRPVFQTVLSSSLTSDTGALIAVEKIFLHNFWYKSCVQSDLPPGW